MTWKYAFGFLSINLAYIMDFSKLAVVIVVVIFVTVVKVAIALLYEFA